MKSLAPTAMSLWQRLRLLAHIIIGSGLFLAVQARAQSVRIETFDLKSGGNVRVENARGATRVEVWQMNSVRIVAEKSEGSLLASELVLMKMENTVFINCRQSPGRVDLTIHVPRGSHLQISGGAWPVEVSGSLSSAVIETTSGQIRYHLPQTDSARIVMRSARGAVRSAIPLEIKERSARELQGQLGLGSSPIMLYSESGQITLLAARESALSALSPQKGQPPETPAPPDGDAQKGAPGDQQGDPSSIALPPSRRPQPDQSGGSVIFSGGARDRTKSTDYSVGPLSRSRQKTESESGSTGIRVRIIPSTPSRSAEENRGEPDLAPRPTYPSARATTDYEPSDDASKEAPVLRRPEAAVGAPAPPAPSSDEDAVVIETSLVNLNVSVINRSGKSIPNLRKDDFRVFENGEPQKIEFFASTNAPFNLVLLLDLSGSIRGKIEVVKSAALRFLEVIGPQDKVAVVTFSSQVNVISELTANRNFLAAAIRSIESPEGGTALYEALWFALTRMLDKTRGQRNAIVVLTDGVDSSLQQFGYRPTRITFDRLARRLEESDVMVFPIYLDTEQEQVFELGNSTAEEYEIARSRLAQMAELTGGQMFQAKRTRDLAGVYEGVAAALRTVYSLGYYPTRERDGSYRRVRVVVNHPDAVVRTRRGYYAR